MWFPEWILILGIGIVGIFIGISVGCVGFFKKYWSNGITGRDIRRTIYDMACLLCECRVIGACICEWLCERTNSCVSECSRPCDNILDSCAKCRRDPGNIAVPVIIVSQESSSFIDG